MIGQLKVDIRPSARAMLFVSERNTQERIVRKMTKMQTGKKDLKQYLGHTGMGIIKEMQDTNQKRVMGALVQRVGDDLDMLDYVQAQVLMPDETAAKENRGTVRAILTSPIVTLLLAGGAMAFVFLCWQNFWRMSVHVVKPAFVFDPNWLLLLLFALLLFGQAIFQLVIRAKAKSAAPSAPEAQLMLDAERAKVQMEKQLSKLINDTEAICGMFQNQQLESVNTYEDELVKLFASLYEAKVDRPDCEEFNYSLTMAEMMLRQIGLKAVPYSEEQKALFTVETEDYPSQMRYPAIVRERTGEVVKKGEYIQNIPCAPN